MDKNIKSYSLEEVKEKFIVNKELFEFKLWVSIELENILKKNQNKPQEYRTKGMVKDIVNLINKIDNG